MLRLLGTCSLGGARGLGVRLGTGSLEVEREVLEGDADRGDCGRGVGRGRCCVMDSTMDTR